MKLTDLFARDKLLHIAAGAAVAWLVSLFAAPIYGILAAFAAGVVKDVVYDRLLKRGAYDPRDIWATALGGVVYSIGGASVLLQLLL